MSPTCADSHALRPSPRQNAFFRSPPTASAGRTGTGSATGSGAYPRERRSTTGSPSQTRTTESSHGTWIGRSWVNHASASAASRSRASASPVTIGSPDTLPLVITSSRGPGGSPGSPSSRWCSGVYGSITPRSGPPGATSSQTGTPGRRRSNTTGRSGPVSSSASNAPTCASGSTPARSRAITANGLRPRALRDRSSATAPGFAASHARW